MSKRRSKAEALAGILLSHHRSKEPYPTPWPAIYALEDLFGVAEGSQWKSVTDAVKHCAQAPCPSPMARYDFTEHAIHVFNGDMLTRIVKLRQIKC